MNPSVLGKKTCTVIQLLAMLKRLPVRSVGGSSMRGSKPKALTILPADRCELERIAHSDTLPWYQVRRARIVLAIAAGQGREDLAIQLACDESTIWRTCQRYRQLGLAGLLADRRQERSGRDLLITPLQRAQIVELACLEPVAKGLHNLLFFLVVQTGRMELAFLPANDQAHYIPELERFRQEHRGWQGVYLVQDGGSSHIGAETRNYFARCEPWWKPRYTPANASWLNQAEILIHAFKHHYLNRGFVGEPRSLHEAYPGFGHGVQRPLRSSL